MTLYLNGTTGVSGVDGSAGTPSLQGNDTNTGIVFGTDTVGVSTGGVQRTTVDSSGRLLVGTASAAGGQVESKTATLGGSDSAYAKKAFIANIPIGIVNTTGSLLAGFDSSIHGVDLGYVFNGTGYNLTLGTNSTTTGSPVERMRINSNGYTKFTTDGSYTGIDTGSHGFRQTVAGDWVVETVNSASTGGIYGINSQFTGQTPNNTSSWFYLGSDPTNNKFIVYSNGGVANYSGNNVNLSDEREKKNIEDLESTWDCLKHWELKKFHYNEDTDTEAKRYGVIAQQVEEHCPEVISEWVKQKAKLAQLDDDGNELEPAKEEVVRMGVKEQQMYWMAIKALQEAQVRIETLEAEVAALKVQ